MSGFSICFIILDIWQGFEYVEYSYNNIIVVTNVIILEFLSAWFIYPGTQHLMILCFLNTS